MSNTQVANSGPHSQDTGTSLARCVILFSVVQIATGGSILALNQDLGLWYFYPMERLTGTLFTTSLFEQPTCQVQ